MSSAEWEAAASASAAAAGSRLEGLCVCVQAVCRLALRSYIQRRKAIVEFCRERGFFTNDQQSKAAASRAPLAARRGLCAGCRLCAVWRSGRGLEGENWQK